MTLKKYATTDPASKSTGSCCAACAATAGCKAWQMITRAGATTTACWLMSVTEAKVGSPDTCVSAVPEGGPLREVRTADIVLLWSDVEPTPGGYNWSVLTPAVTRAQRLGGKIILLLWTGQDSPHWLYNHSGVPILARSTENNIIVPDYTNEAYQRRLKAVHQSMALAIESMSSAVVAVQPCVGSTGDDTPIHLTSGTGHIPSWTYINRTLVALIGGPGSGSNSTWWTHFTRDFAMWLAFNSSAFAKPIEAGNLVLLVNAQGTSFPLDWVNENLPGSFLKFGQSGHEYQSNYERFRVATQAPFVYSLQKGMPVRSRAELSSETCWTMGPFENASCSVPWNVYAMTMWVASAHLDFWNIQPNADPEILSAFRPLWRFLNRYAGLRWAWQSTGAWIGFRDGLDAMDTERFPEDRFGAIDINQHSADGYPELQCGADTKINENRAIRICFSHQAQGCRIDVSNALCPGPMSQRRAPGMNDVAFGNWRDDYGNFMRQIDTGTSRGWWRLGSTSSLFGRFARGFADPTNRTAVLPLQLDHGLWGGLPLSSTTVLSLTVRLVFLDAGKGSFSVGYDGQVGPTTLTTVSKTGTGKWRELCKVITDARFGGAGPSGADIWLANDDDQDDIFDSLEVAVGTPADVAIAGCDWNSM